MVKRWLSFWLAFSLAGSTIGLKATSASAAQGVGHQTCSLFLGTTSTRMLVQERVVPAAGQASNGKNVPGAGKESKNQPPGPSSHEKRDQAMGFLNAVVANADSITPAEYRVLALVEAAAILWKIDRERASWILQRAVTLLAELFDEDKELKKDRSTRDSYSRRIRFLVLRKIAAIDPSLLKEFFGRNSAPGQAKQPLLPEWTDEARAMIVVASEQIEKDPGLAARIMTQSLTLGLAGWENFLRQLTRRDAAEAERLEFVLIDKLRDSSAPPAVLRNLGNYVLAEGRSAGLQQHFFRSLSVSLRRDCNTEIPLHQLEGDTQVAREMSHRAGSQSWKIEFDNLAQECEAVFTARASAPTGPVVRIVIDTSAMNAAAPADTEEITNALSKVQSSPDSLRRDKEYQSLATQAALSADVRLAEDILSKIENDVVRQDTTLMVYGPLVRKAMQESDWSQSMAYAFKIVDPLGRTLVLDRIASAIAPSRDSKLSRANKVMLKELYDSAMSSLDRETPTMNVARAYLVLGKSLSANDPERTLTALNSCVSVLYKAGTSAESMAAVVSPAATTWVRFKDPVMSPDESLDLTEFLGVVFKEVASRDVGAALAASVGLSHPGLRSLAQLAISKALLDSEKEVPSKTAKPKPAHKP